MEYKTGTLVYARGRDWVVLSSEDENLLRLKPLDGREEDVVGIYLPLTNKGDIRPSQFMPPKVADLGSIRAARLLFDASRLSLRSAAGPFRCAAKLGFRPRSYQMVPLIMALKQKETVRLLIADDVGVGKTVEAILIAKELLERREIKRFAVLCPPHLCEQWQSELKEKFQIDAVIIRTGTQAALDRKIPDDTSVYEFYPYQVISIDYIKGDSRSSVFVSQAPELVIVDEAHSCACPEGQSSSSQQLRHRLVRALADKKDQHLILVTATPHSGKEGEFRSLLGLLKNDFKNLEWDTPDVQDNGVSKKVFRTELAKYFVQRKRQNIAVWMNEKTPFPTRTPLELPYKLSLEYQAVYDEILLYTSKMMSRTAGTENEKRFRYWSALALLRGVMSSPRSGVRMFENRIASCDEQAEEALENPHFERLEMTDDELPVGVVSQANPTDTDRIAFDKFAKKLSLLNTIENDKKLASCIKQIQVWHSQGFSPIIFCRFIETAKYVGEKLTEILGKGVLVECVTSEDPDEVRRERITKMAEDVSGKKLRVLVATDCLSEGINLQDLFDAVLHYDLPWNPNRLEQREGRVDRFGQKKPEIQTGLLYGYDNPMDQVVLKVLFKKAKKIRDNIGVSIPFPEDSKVFLDTIFQAVLAEAEKKQRPVSQPELFSLEEMVRSEEQLQGLFDMAERKEQALRSIFAQASIKAQDIEEDLSLTDEAVGRPETVHRFVSSAFDQLFGTAAVKNDEELEIRIRRSTWPEKMRSWLEKSGVKDEARIAFRSPVRDSFTYWGRNHDAVEMLCRSVLSEALNTGKKNPGAARASVVLSSAVKERTVLYVVRARHVIEDKRTGSHLVAEEILVQGVCGMERKFIDQERINSLMDNPNPSGDLPYESQKQQLERELSVLDAMNERFNNLAEERAKALIEQHERYQKALGQETKTERYKVVKPVIPLDILGMYIFVPGGLS